MSNCHICGGQLDEFESFSTFHQVTSDCRPWCKDGRLGICQRCGNVQKPITKKWLKEAEDIYYGYEMYSQADGLEQSTFDSSSGASETRSKRIVSWLSKIGLLKSGKLLDIGCGNGWFSINANIDDRNQWDCIDISAEGIAMENDQKKHFKINHNNYSISSL